MQFLPPDDEKMCSKHVEAWNKTVSQSTITKPFVTLRCAPTCFGPYMAILREISKQRNTVMANTLKDTQRHAESSHGPQWNNFVHALSSNDGLAKVKIYTTYSHPGSLYRLPPPPPSGLLSALIMHVHIFNTVCHVLWEISEDVPVEAETCGKYIVKWQMVVQWLCSCSIEYCLIKMARNMAKFKHPIALFFYYKPISAQLIP